MTRSSKQYVQEKRAQRRRQTRLWLIGGIALGAVLITGLLILLSLPDATESFSYEGLEQSIVDSGAVGFAVGSPDAPVTLTEYSDFSCTHCHDLTASIHRLIDEYGRDGRLRVIFKPISFVRPPASTEAAKAAVCAAQQGQFWQMHDEIWRMYERGGPSSYTQGSLSAAARDVGLDAAEFAACYDSEQTQASVDGVLAEAQAMGINGTPSLLVNGEMIAYTGAEAIYETLKEAIDTALDSAGSS